MKASELRDKIDALIKEHGDLECYIDVDSGCLLSVDGISLNEGIFTVSDEEEIVEEKLENGFAIWTT